MPSPQIASQERVMRTRDGIRLKWKIWEPPTQFVGTVIILHGLGEHIGRYTHVAKPLAEVGYRVMGLDFRGHGTSPGLPMVVEDVNVFADDVLEFMNIADEKTPGMPLFLLGHSFGGTVALHTLIRHQIPVDGLVLSAPAIKAGSDIPNWLLRVGEKVGKVAPRMPTIRFDPASLSRDTAVGAAYAADPLVHHIRIPAQTGVALTNSFAYLARHLHRFNIPFLILHGTEDRITNIEGSKLLHRKAQTEDKTIKLYAGYYHELFNEFGKEAIIQNVVEWIKKRTVLLDPEEDEMDE